MVISIDNFYSTKSLEFVLFNPENPERGEKNLVAFKNKLDTLNKAMPFI